MLSERDLVARIERVTVTRLRVWVAHGWIRPASAVPEAFSEADMARAALIRDLEEDLGFGEEDIPVLLHLIDQIHGLRSELTCLIEAVGELPEDVRATVRLRIAALRRPRG